LSRLQAAVALALDLALCGLVALVIHIAAFGGAHYTIGRVSVGLRSIDNPLSILFGAALLRLACASWAPFLMIERLSIEALKSRTADGLLRFDAWARAVPFCSLIQPLAVLAGTTLCLKVLFASIDVGFFSGDDVEVHEMTLGSLLHAAWPVWDLRSPIYPCGFIYPAQALALHTRWYTTGGLVVAGRYVVAVISTCALFAMWRIAAARHRDAAGYAFAATLFLGLSRLFVSFGSTELPRPVSSVLVLVGFLVLRQPTVAATLAGAGCIGFAGSLRFSEFIFLVPAIVERLLRRQWKLAIVLILGSFAVASVLLGYADKLYWGDWFHSLNAALDFTLVKRLSSRGYQPPWWYLVNVQQWTNVTVTVLAAIGLKKDRALALWTVLPLLCLSALPHKEARYAIPVLPFVCLLAAAGLRVIAGMDVRSWQRAWLPAALAAALVYGFVHDLTHYRLPRSNREIMQLTRLLPVLPPERTLVVEQLWRVGGHLYLNGRPGVDLDPSDAANAWSLRNHLTAKSCLFIDERTLRASADVQRFLSSRNAVALSRSVGDPYVVWMVDP